MSDEPDGKVEERDWVEVGRDIQRTRLNRSLSHLAPSPDAVPKIEAIREAGKAFGEVIIASTSPTEGATIRALTAVEEAVMWAVKCVVIEDAVSRDNDG